MILTADHGVTMGMMDRDNYIKKAEELVDQTTYKTISADPTTKCKNKLFTLLKIIKAEDVINELSTEGCILQGQDPPNSMSYQRFIKETAKELVRILKPLVGRSPHCVQNNRDFIQHIKGIHLQAMNASYPMM